MPTNDPDDLLLDERRQVKFDMRASLSPEFILQGLGT